jgi:hypothetical protein
VVNGEDATHFPSNQGLHDKEVEELVAKVDALRNVLESYNSR